nr:hypothetical protein [Tanacetum cinerariifolium]
MLVHQGEGSGTPTKPQHTPFPEVESSHPNTSSIPLPSIPIAPIPTVTQPDTTPIIQYSRRTRIAQSSALPTVADEPVSPVRDVSEGEACPTVSSFIADQDRATIANSSSLPHDLAPRVTSPAADEGSMQQNISELTALCTSLQRQYFELISKFQAQEEEIVRLKERVQVLKDREGVATKQSRVDAPINGRSNNEGEAVAERISNELEEIARVLTSMDAATVLTGEIDVPTSSGFIPTAGPPATVISTGSEVGPTASPIVTRRKDEEVMLESDTPKKKKLQEQIDAQRKPMTKKQKKEYYMAVIKSNLGWRFKDFKGMTFEEIEVKFAEVWKQVEDFIPMGSKEESERLKRKGLNLEKEQVKKQKSSEEPPEIETITKEFTKEKLKEMMQLVPVEDVYVQALQFKHPIIDWKVHSEGQRSYWQIIRLGGSSACYQFFVDLLRQLDREDLNQLWALVKEYLSIRPASSEWKLYDLSGVHHVTAKDKEIFMLVEKDYPLKRGRKFPLAVYVPTASEGCSHCQKIRDATVRTTVLAGETNVPTDSGFILTVSPPATVISTSSEVGPTASPIVTRRKGKEVMVEDFITMGSKEESERLKRKGLNLEKEQHSSSEGSGNPNPTASSFNPPADQLETLTVESLIPTVSSPVPTTCLNDSSEPSSDARLVSKRVANQEETPSLDNILSLMNRFEDILGVSTSSDEIIGVEADVSNMETSISASPTPTLKIHKDHPKSQIIGHVDTPIQTRHKSKMVKEQSFMATIHQKTDPALLQFCLFSCFLSQVEPKKMDVKSAFLYRTIEEEVYVMQPPGFQDLVYPTKVYKVEKAMYGLHQAPRAWHREDFILFQVYVDDIIFGSLNPQLCREFEALMHEKFQMSAMGELNFFLGLQVLQKEDGIFLSQDKYIGDILKKFGFLDSPPTDRSDFTHEEFTDELAYIISPPEYDCFYFRNLPDSGEWISILNSGIRENLSSTTRVNLPVEDDHSPLLVYVVWILLAYLTYPVIPPYLHLFGNEDTIFNPGIAINRFYSFKPGLSHRCETFKKFKTHRSHLNESLMEMLFSTCFPMDQ